MSRLKILSSTSPFRVRIRLFEALIADVLRHKKYRIDSKLVVSEKEMQIDAEGQHVFSGLPFYAECRCYDHAIAASELQAFYGKYMTRWHKNNTCHGIFLALPCLANPAKQFFQEHIENNPAVTAYLYENDDVLDSISHIHGIIVPDTLKRPIAQHIGKPDDHFLLYTEKGIFWAQYIISHGKKTPDRIALFNINGTPLSDQCMREYLKALYPEFDRLEDITIGAAVQPQSGLFHVTDEIVETSGSSGLFDYHLPVSAERFVGRESLLAEFDSFIDAVMDKTTDVRSIVMESPSGWGKSSTVLACAARLNALGHPAVAVDSRTASSPKFALRVFDYAINKIAYLKTSFKKEGGTKGLKKFDGSVKAIQHIGKQLASHNRLMVVFFDQFENLFFVPELLQDIKNLLLNVRNAQSNVVLCFSWPTDVSGLDNELFHSVHHFILAKSMHVNLNPFSDTDITALFDLLSDELNESIDKNLRSDICKLSQGYPWLINRWFAHVNDMVKKGNSASDIFTTIPDVKDLFQQDVESLPVLERDALLYIAKTAPVSIFDADKSFEHRVVQNLMARKLVIKIGSVFDVYSDIFRNYLITGDLQPIENYIFRAPVAEVLNAVKVLAQEGGFLNMLEFRKQMELAEGSLSKIIHEMNLLGFTQVIEGHIRLLIKETRPPRKIDVALRSHLREQFRKHRPVRLILKKAKDKKSITLDEMAEVLKMTSPNMSVTKTTWIKHARTLAKWMDVADMGLWSKQHKALIYLNPKTDIRARDLLLPKRRGSKTPWIQYAYVQQIAIRLVQALDENGNVDWSGLGKNSIFRALAALEDLGFIGRSASVIKVLPKGIEFVRHSKKRSVLFAESALKIPAFSLFVGILTAYQERGNTLLKLGLELRDALAANWQESTAEVVAKILLDWARHAKLAPGVFAEPRKGPIKGWKRKEDRQLRLF